MTTFNCVVRICILVFNLYSWKFLKSHAYLVQYLCRHLGGQPSGLTMLRIWREVIHVTQDTLSDRY